MRVVRVRLRDFRSHATAELSLGPGLTVIAGANGAGKTNLLEAVYFGCTGRSCRTMNEREVVRFGAAAARVEVHAEDVDGTHELSVGFAPGEPKRVEVDGIAVERLLDVSARPLVSVFLPERLELVKGGPGGRRAHLDRFVAALWPGRAATRRGYVQALAQRNALLARVRAGASDRGSLAAWDAELARHGATLIADRARAADLIAHGFAVHGEALGLDGAPTIAYRPRSGAKSAAELAAELAQRIDRDLERGFTGHGPHRDELAILREGRPLRAYGSQGQQRLAVLALLLAERDAIATERAAPPLMLLDDVMSELDDARRARLASLLRDSGQTVVTTTDPAQVPDGEASGTVRIVVREGLALHGEAVAA